MQSVTDNTWTPLQFHFDVDEESAEVELVAEFAANQGGIAFDRRSMRLVRK